MKKSIFKKKSPPVPPFILYPNMAEDDAYDKLFWKKEFANTRYGAEFMHNTSDAMVCKHRTKEDFELQNPQEFVKNLISPETNYNGLLILHGTGVGKTCSAIGITEGLRDYIHKNGKKMFIITPSENIRENFLKELRLTGCAKNNYDKKIIDEYYVFMGFGQFSNFIDRTLKQNPEELDRHFSNSIIIIDEAHGIAKPPGKKEDIEEDLEDQEQEEAEAETSSNDDEDVEAEAAGHQKRRTLFSVLTKTIIPHTKGLKLVLLSATPMKDNITEMADLIEILNNNDDRVVPKEFRQKLIRFKENKIDISEIRDDLLYYSKGYVSFARGNNPISFPREVKPPIELLYSPRPKYAFEDGQTAFDYTVTNPFNLPFDYNYELVKCPMGTDQYKTYEKLYSLKSIEKNYTQKLSWISNMLLPRTTQDMDLKAAFQRTFPALKKKDIGDLGLRYEIKKDDVQLFQSNLSNYSGKMHKFITNVRQSPGIAFAYSEFITYGTKIAAFLLELNGFVHYHHDLYKNLHNGQPTEAFLPHCTLLKFARTTDSYTCAVCGERLSHHTGKTHTFLFNTYVLITGETDKRNRMNYIKTASSNPAQCKCGKLYENHTEEDHVFESIIGNIGKPTPPMDQRYGQVIKTVIGTRIIGQGVDFKWIRQVHILEPWHNNTRIYQVIGRGLRYCSHADLPKAERDVMVYRYCSSPNRELTTDVETIDEHVYARVMRKDIQVKQIERILKENAVDCEFNRHLNMMPNDKDYTRECDYMPCKYTCQGYANPIKYNEIRVGRRPTGEWFVFDKEVYPTDFDYESLPVVNETMRALGSDRFVTRTPNGTYLLEEPITSLKALKMDMDTDLTDNLDIWKYLLELGGKIVEQPRGEYLYLDIPMNGVPDMSTYDIYFQKPLINKVEKIIIKLFTRKIIYTLKTLMYYIKNEITCEDSIIYLALDNLLTNKTVIKDIHEREGYLINKGIFYIFQPTYLIDKTIPLYYREAEIPYKPIHASIPFVKPLKPLQEDMTFNVDDFLIKKHDSYYAQMNAAPEVMELIELNNRDFTEETKNIISEIFGIGTTGMYKNKKLAIISTRYEKKNSEDWQWTMPPLKSTDFDFALFVLLDFQGFVIWGGKIPEIPAQRILSKSDILPYLTPIKTRDDLDAFIQ
jgi:superfamily II DNA or RNA helicase